MSSLTTMPLLMFHYQMHDSHGLASKSLHLAVVWIDSSFLMNENLCLGSLISAACLGSHQIIPPFFYHPCTRRGPSPFSFENMWNPHPQFQDNISRW